MKPYQEELQAIDHEAMERHLRKLASMDKLSGSEEASQAADYILKVLKKDGVPCHMEVCEGYVSNPIQSSLKIDGNVDVCCRPRAFSGDCRQPISGELIFDAASEVRKRAELTEDFLAKVKGKVVLSYGYDEKYALLLEKYGAAAWIQIWTSDDPLIHEDTISCVWGTPTVDSSLFLLKMPVLGVTRSDGEALIRRISVRQQAGERSCAEITVSVESRVSALHIPVAEIRGESEDFVLVSCHYDTWFKGAVDNGTANAAAIEIAKVCNRFKHRMKRSVKIAWWSGHSNGRYAGSAWYCDNHFAELKARCIAHINADLIGAKGCLLIGMHTAGAEGRDYLRQSVDFIAPQEKIRYFGIGRGADQSFFGPEVPYHIYSRYETEPDEKPFDTPGSGSYQWHTIEDTIDGVDWEIYRKDAALFFLNAWRFLAEERLPFAAEEFFGDYQDALAVIGQDAEAEFSTAEIQTAVSRIGRLFRETAKRPEAQNMEQQYIRLICGRLNRLRFSYGSPYDHDLAITATSPFPRLSMVRGVRREKVGAARYLFIRTEFIRQKNRMLCELAALEEELLKLRSDNRE